MTDLTIYTISKVQHLMVQGELIGKIHNDNIYFCKGHCLHLGDGCIVENFYYMLRGEEK